MKYRLIAGTINHYEAEEGWENVHLDATLREIWHPGLRVGVLPDVQARVEETPFKPDTFDEVRMHHVLEHVPLPLQGRAVAEVHRVLVPDGVLDVEIPNMNAIAEAWLAARPGVFEGAERAGLNQWIYGEDLGENHYEFDSHRAALGHEELDELLHGAGFETVERWMGNGSLAVRVRARAVKEEAGA